MLALILSLASLITIIVVLIYLFMQLDCDLSLFFYEKFGGKPGSLRNKVIWITGASSGIGEALSFVLANNGCKLVLSGTNQTNLSDVRRKCLNANATLKSDDVLIVAFDVTDVDKHEQRVKEVFDHFGKIDILVNNAGKSQRAAFEEIDLAVDKELFDINVFGLLHLTRIVVRHWYRNQLKGHIVVTSSVTGKMGAPYSATYTGSKHALHGYFEALRLESYFQGLRITMVCPGPVFSNVLKNAKTGKVGETVGVEHDSKSKRMETKRCAELMAVAIANEVYEAWIADQPYLSVFYGSQYFPTITRFCLTRFMTKESYSQLRDGR